MYTGDLMGSWLSYDAFDDMFIACHTPSHQTDHIHDQSKYKPRLVLEQGYDDILDSESNHICNVRDGGEHAFDFNITSCNKTNHHAGATLANDHGAKKAGDH